MNPERPPRRGPYKRWINDAGGADLPKTTKWRRRCESDEDFEDLHLGNNAGSIDRSPLLDEEEHDTFDNHDTLTLGGQDGRDAAQHDDDDDSSSKSSEPVESHGPESPPVGEYKQTLGDINEESATHNDEPESDKSSNHHDDECDQV